MLSNCLKHPIDDAIEHSTKRVTPIKNYKQPMKMPHARPTPPKEKEVYELNSNGIFLKVRIKETCKLVLYFNILILPM
jgi:hypothetical protein